MSMIDDAMTGRRWSAPSGAELGGPWVFRLSAWGRAKARAARWLLVMEVQSNG